MKPSFAVISCLLEWGIAAQWLERVTYHWKESGSIPAGAVSKFWQFRLPHSACVFLKILKSHIVPFYLVSETVEGKYPTLGVNV